MDVLLTFSDLIKRQVPEFDPGKEWKVLRHRDTHPDAPDLLGLTFTAEGRRALEFYQSFQSKDILRDCDGFFTFVGLPNRRALFIGAYWKLTSKLVNRPPPTEVPTPFQPIWTVWHEEQGAEVENVRYSLKRDARFEALERRVVIDWGRGALAWHQWQLDKPVVELRDPGSHGPCPDYADIDISLAQLSQLMERGEANRSWKERLSAVAGIYLLTDRLNNRLYVGKADGKGGLWRRWQAYAKLKTGNVAVDAAITADDLQADSTSLSILQVVPLGSGTKELVDRLESRWKERLRTRTGENYNRN